MDPNDVIYKAKYEKYKYKYLQAKQEGGLTFLDGFYVFYFSKDAESGQKLISKLGGDNIRCGLDAPSVSELNSMLNVECVRQKENSDNGELLYDRTHQFKNFFVNPMKNKSDELRVKLAKALSPTEVKDLDKNTKLKTFALSSVDKLNEGNIKKNITTINNKLKEIAPGSSININTAVAIRIRQKGTNIVASKLITIS